ncbi:MAG: hypothetical protein AAGI91_15905 [Bacteroidota bacterium]
MLHRSRQVSAESTDRLHRGERSCPARKGYDPVFGARPLKRVLQREIANQLAEQMLAGFVREGDTVEIDALPDGSGLTLTTDAAAPSEDAVTAPAAEA